MEVENPEVFESFSKIMAKFRKEKPNLNLGVYEYLCHKNPQFSQFSDKFTRTLKN